MSYEVDFGKCFSQGWELYKSNFGVLVLSTLVAMLISALTCGILSAPLLVGLFWVIDRVRKNDPEVPSAGDVFKGMSKFGPAFLCFILFIAVFAILSIVPIIGTIISYIASPMMMFAFLYIAFEDLDALESFKRVCNELFSGKLLMPVVIGIVAGLAGGVGALACGIGVIFTVPFTYAVYLCTYYEMKALDDDIIDAEVVDSDEAPTGETRPEGVPPHSPEQDETKDKADPAAGEKKDEEKPSDL